MPRMSRDGQIWRGILNEWEADRMNRHDAAEAAPTANPTYQLSNEEVCLIIDALRSYQLHVIQDMNDSGIGEYPDIIDQLCERLNCGDDNG